MKSKPTSVVAFMAGNIIRAVAAMPKATLTPLEQHKLAITAYVTTHPGATCDETACDTGIERSDVQRILCALAGINTLHRVRKGTTMPYRYWLTSADTRRAA